MYIKEVKSTLNLAQLVKELVVGGYSITEVSYLTLELCERYLSLYSTGDYREWKIDISGHCSDEISRVVMDGVKKVDVKYADRKMSGDVYIENVIQMKDGSVEFSLLGHGALIDIEE